MVLKSAASRGSGVRLDPGHSRSCAPSSAPCAQGQRWLLNMTGVLGRSRFFTLLEAVGGLFPPSSFIVSLN